MRGTVFRLFSWIYFFRNGVSGNLKGKIHLNLKQTRERGRRSYKIRKELAKK
jgi:hypothetical protein